MQKTHHLSLVPEQTKNAQQEHPGRWKQETSKEKPIHHSEKTDPVPAKAKRKRKKKKAKGKIASMRSGGLGQGSPRVLGGSEVNGGRTPERPNRVGGCWL